MLDDSCILTLYFYVCDLVKLSAWKVYKIWTTDVINTGDTLADTMETRKPKDLRLDANKKPGMVLLGFCVGCI